MDCQLTMRLPNQEKNHFFHVFEGFVFTSIGKEAFSNNSTKVQKRQVFKICVSSSRVLQVTHDLSAGVLINKHSYYFKPLITIS